MRLRSLSVAVVAVMATSLVVDAQSPHAPAQPAFRAGTTLVEVSAIVTDKGAPVADLRAEDFTVLDNGKPQPLVAFERVDLGSVDGPAQRRDFVIVLDDLHIEAGVTAQAILAAENLLDRLGPYDRVAVIRTAPPDEPIEFSVDRAGVRNTISGFRGQKLTGPPMPGEVEMRARAALAVITQVAEAVRGDSAERRTVLLISEGHNAFMFDPRPGARDDVRGVYLEFLEVLRQAALSNVSIYTVDPRGLKAPGVGTAAVRGVDTSGGAGSLSADLMSSLRPLATETGGLQTRWTNDLMANYARMIDDSRQYYRLAYAQPDPPPNKRQPATRRIQVKVAREDVQVRARQRYAPLQGGR